MKKLDKHTKKKHSYLFSYSSLNETVFQKREDAVKVVLKAEQNNKKKISNEVYYEEY